MSGVGILCAIAHCRVALLKRLNLGRRKWQDWNFIDKQCKNDLVKMNGQNYKDTYQKFEKHKKNLCQIEIHSAVPVRSQQKLKNSRKKFIKLAMLGKILGNSTLPHEVVAHSCCNYGTFGGLLFDH